MKPTCCIRKLFSVGISMLWVMGCFVNYGCSNDDESEVLTDKDGNEYKTKTFGTTIWMTENLKTTRFNDGSQIELHPNEETWFSLSRPVYCWYTNDETNHKASYGALYNWYAVTSGKLCPVGWHVPTEEEWQALEMFLGMSDTEASAPFGWRGEADNIGGKMKEAGLVHWSAPNKGATNESEFGALPGGARNLYGIYEYVNDYGYWWTSTDADNSNGIARSISYNLTSIYKSHYFKQSGFSVRCVINK
jgi:uncharacterized protein (TIGR02145 family)